eukprot:gene3724-3770_t
MVFWEAFNSIIQALIAVLLLAIFFKLFSQYTLDLMISNGGQFFFVILLISCLIPGARYKVILRDIRSQILITKSNEQLKSQNHDINEKNNIIDAQYEQLRKLDNQKNSFINIAGHDLKNLVGSIIMSNNMLKEEDYRLSADQLELIGYITESSEKMQYLLNKLMDVKEIESPEMKFNLEVFDVNAEVLHVFKGLIETAQMKNIHLIDNILKLPLSVNLDKVFAGQVFQNLLSNAIKFSQTNNNIRVVTSLQRQRFVFEIIDEGIAIGQAELDMMFNKLKTLSEASDHVESRLGLGLSIAKLMTQEMGHNDDAIYGMSGASSIYVKISPTVEINGSKLVLYFEPSQALIKEHSFINIILNDKPVYSARLSRDSIQKISLDLNRENVSADKYLKIQIKTLLTITDDICRDLDNPAMWIKVKDYSVKNYIQVGNLSALPEDKRSQIKVTPQANEGIFYLSKSSSTATDTITQMVNEKGKMVAHKSVTTETVPTEVLFISGGDDAGYDKAITALENTYFKTIDENRSKLTLKQVGGTSDFLSGIGSLKSAYSFKNSDFSFTPKEVEIRFIGTYSGLNPGDRGYFNIYLNGLLISSEKLDASGKLNTSVTINRYQHHKYNTLESEFRFFPTSGECKNSFINFFGEVDVDKSYLESKNPFISSDLSFYQYPEAFNTGTTRIVVSKDIAKYSAGAVGEIIYELNNNINSNNFPEFVYSNEIPAGDLKKYNIIALLNKDDKLMSEFPDAPVKFNQNFHLYYTDNNKLVYSLSDTVSTGLAQIFYGRSNNATLVLTATGAHQSDALLAASRSITEQLSTLSSNVCVTDVNSNKYLFNINKSSENLEYVDTKSTLTRFWDNYNLYILLGILILILLSFLFVRSRVQRSQELYND